MRNDKALTWFLFYIHPLSYYSRTRIYYVDVVDKVGYLAIIIWPNTYHHPSHKNNFGPCDLIKSNSLRPFFTTFWSQIKYYHGNTEAILHVRIVQYYWLPKMSRYCRAMQNILQYFSRNISHISHGENDEGFKNLTRYRSEKKCCQIIKIIL